MIYSNKIDLAINYWEYSMYDVLHEVLVDLEFSELCSFFIHVYEIVNSSGSFRFSEIGVDQHFCVGILDNEKLSINCEIHDYEEFGIQMIVKFRSFSKYDIVFREVDGKMEYYKVSKRSGSQTVQEMFESFLKKTIE